MSKRVNNKKGRGSRKSRKFVQQTKVRCFSIENVFNSSYNNLFIKMMGRDSNEPCRG